MSVIENYPKLLHQWSDKNSIDAKVIKYNDDVHWWICDKGHEWQSSVQLRVKHKTVLGCPFCQNRRVTKENCLATVNPKIALEWHPTKNNQLTPSDVIAKGIQKVWWLCPKGHSYDASLNNRTNVFKSKGCPYCSGKRVDETNCLATTHPDIATEWHLTKNTLTPQTITQGSNKKVWWLGTCGHEWIATVCGRTSKLRRGCPYCRESKGEKKIAEILTEMKIGFTREVMFPTCRFINPLPFDFQIENKKLLIEYQGEQHYMPKSFGGDANFNFERTKTNDVIKKNWCEKEGYKLIIISYMNYSSIRELLKDTL